MFEYFNKEHLRWKVESFSHLFPPQVAAEILSMPPPAHNIGVYMPIWDLTSDGAFSSKSAYEAMNSAIIVGSNLAWDQIWKGDVPFKINNFTWCCLNDGVWVNGRRWRSNLTSDPRCPLCLDEAESLLHLFRDCAAVKPLWLRLVLPQHLIQFFTGDFRSWVMQNIYDMAL